jgi:Na+/H+-dicarboxylate symporter
MTSKQPSPSSEPATPLAGSFAVQIFAAMLIGLAAGFLARWLGPLDDGSPNGLTVALQTIGSIFVQLLKTLVPPLVFTAIVASIANLGALRNAARLIVQSLMWFGITAIIAVAIGIVLGLALHPGGAAAIEAAAASRPATSGGWLDFLKGLVPANMFGLAATSKLNGETVVTSLGFNTLQIVVIALVVGIAAARSGKAAEPFIAAVQSLLSIVKTILWWVIRLTPIGTIGLLGNAVVQYGWDTLAQLGGFAGAVYLGLFIVLFGVYPALLLAHRLSPVRFFQHAWPALQLAFVSRSSIGTLPVTETVTERLGVPREYASFIVPIAATTKMDGCAAIYPAIAALFIAQFYGIALDPSDYLLIVLVSVIGSAATAGLTGATVMLTLTLSTLGLPLEGVGLLLAIDPILDMGRTAVNVAGQILVPTIVAQREKILDLARFTTSRQAEVAS